MNRLQRWALILLSCVAVALLGTVFRQAFFNSGVQSGDVPPVERQAASRRTLPPDYGREFGGGYSSVDLRAYEISNPDNVLPLLESSYVCTCGDDGGFPVLDGAEAAFPVYSAFARNCYPGVEEIVREDEARKTHMIYVTGKPPVSAYEQYGPLSPVQFTNTIYAFEALVDGSVDIFFGAQPSQAQWQLAEQAGVELELTPIGLEAFVFFVSKENPVDNLGVDQIRAIYSDRIRNWSTLGGTDEEILAYQRPEGSGSQTLLQHIMGDIPIADPPREEMMLGMGDFFSMGSEGEAAEYKNSPGSIGFSFRAYLTNMTSGGADAVKLLKVDGVYPDDASIRTGTYPFTTNLYAITVRGNARVPARFLKWMCEEQGQQIVEGVGYVPLIVQNA